MTMYRQAQITCPRCATALVAMPAPQSTQHTCTGCGGVWIEEEDLRRLFEELSLDPLAPLGPLELEEGSLRCPRCRKAMAVERTHGAEPTAEIDVCPDHGAWFDRGELTLALDRLQIKRIDKERGPYHGVSAEELIFVWLYRLFRPDPAEPPPRTRGRPP
jgi:Zn-finger nucleic acid-binding protein